MYLVSLMDVFLLFRNFQKCPQGYWISPYKTQKHGYSANLLIGLQKTVYLLRQTTFLNLSLFPSPLYSQWSPVTSGSWRSWRPARRASATAPSRGVSKRTTTWRWRTGPAWSLAPLGWVLRHQVFELLFQYVVLLSFVDTVREPHVLIEGRVRRALPGRPSDAQVSLQDQHQLYQ